MPKFLCDRWCQTAPGKSTIAYEHILPRRDDIPQRGRGGQDPARLSQSQAADMQAGRIVDSDADGIEHEKTERELSPSRRPWRVPVARASTNRPTPSIGLSIVTWFYVWSIPSADFSVSNGSSLRVERWSSHPLRRRSVADISGRCLEFFPAVSAQSPTVWDVYR